MLQDQGSKGKSPAHDLSPRSTPAESKVNLLQELTRVLHELFNCPARYYDNNNNNNNNNNNDNDNNNNHNNNNDNNNNNNYYYFY